MLAPVGKAILRINDRLKILLEPVALEAALDRLGKAVGGDAQAQVAALKLGQYGRHLRE